VIPLPPSVVDILRGYVRPAANPIDDLFFLTVCGNPYAQSESRDGTFKPSNTISRLFRELMENAGLSVGDGRNFSGLRTSFYNLAPRSGYDVERSIIMGHARGTIELDSYLEDVGCDRLAHVVNHVWGQVQMEIDKLNSERRDAAAKDHVPSAA
jgi:integrase